MEAIQYVNKYFNLPQERADDPFGKLSKDSSFVESLGPRSLYVLQAIVSAFAILILPLVGLIEAAINKCSHKSASDSLGYMGKRTLEHAICILPMSLLMAFARVDYSPSTVNTWCETIAPLVS